jgi:hypothetical protein
MKVGHDLPMTRDRVGAAAPGRPVERSSAAAVKDFMESNNPGEGVQL